MLRRVLRSSDMPIIIIIKKIAYFLIVVRPALEFSSQKDMGSSPKKANKTTGKNTKQSSAFYF